MFATKGYNIFLKKTRKEKMINGNSGKVWNIPQFMINAENVICPKVMIRKEGKD